MGKSTSNDAIIMAARDIRELVQSVATINQRITQLEEVVDWLQKCIERLGRRLPQEI